MQLTSKQINEIAEYLESGFLIYVNTKTLEFREILDYEDMDEDLYEEQMEDVEKWEDYIVIEKPTSNEAFRFMEDFTEEITNATLKRDLIKILSRRSPFANFKDEIESSKFRQQWFDFRRMKFIDYVKDILVSRDIDFEGRKL